MYFNFGYLRLPLCFENNQKSDAFWHLQPLRFFQHGQQTAEVRRMITFASLNDPVVPLNAINHSLLQTKRCGLIICAYDVRDGYVRIPARRFHRRHGFCESLIQLLALGFGVGLGQVGVKDRVAVLSTHEVAQMWVLTHEISVCFTPNSEHRGA